VNDSSVLECARVRGQEFRRVVVRAFDDKIDGAGELARVVRKKTTPHELDARRLGCDALEARPGGVELVSSHVVVSEEDLSMKIRHLDDVVVGEHEAAEPGPREGERGRGAQAADADDEDALPREPVALIERSTHRD
jgi:hypothetical protein